MHDAVRVEPVGRRLERGHPERALLGREVRRVVAPDAVLVADRPAVGDDRLARGRLEPSPALERLVRVGGQAEDVGRVQARPARVEVRQVAEGVDPLADRRRGRAAAPARARAASVRQRRPVDRRLQRVRRRSRRPTARCAGTAARTAVARHAGADTRQADAARRRERADRPRPRSPGRPRPVPVIADEHEARARALAAPAQVAAEQRAPPVIAGQRDRGRVSSGVETRTIAAAGRPGPGARPSVQRPRPSRARCRRGRRRARGAGTRPDGDVGDDPEPALRAEHELAQVRAGRRCRDTAAGRAIRRASRRGRRRTGASIRPDPSDSWPADRVATQPPTVEILERLREVAERQAALGRGPPRPPGRSCRRRTSRDRSSRRGPRRPGEPVEVDVTTGRSPGRTVTPPTTLVPPPYGMTVAAVAPRRGRAASRTSAAVAGGPRRPGLPRRRPVRSATQSGRLWPRAWRTRSSGSSVEADGSGSASRDGGDGRDTSSSAASRGGVAGADEHRDRIAGGRSAAVTVSDQPRSPQPFHRRPAGRRRSERRPGDGRPGRGGEREAPPLRAGVDPPDRGPHLGRREQRAQVAPEVAIERRRGSAPGPASSSASNGVPRQPHSTVRSFGRRPRSRPRGRRRRRAAPPSTGRMWPPLRSVLLTAASNAAIRRSRGSSSRTRRRRRPRVGLDERLDHALAERAVAQDRRRDDAPAGRLGHEVGGDLAAGQRAVREVVERALADGRLVDRLDDACAAPAVGAGQGDRDEQRVVARPDDPPDDLDLAVAQDLQRRIARSSTPVPAS